MPEIRETQRVLDCGGMEEETPTEAEASTAEESQQQANAPTPNGSESRLTASSSVHRDIFEALEIVERDSVAIAESFTSLFSSLRIALSEVTSTSVEHMRCFNEAAGRLQESARPGLSPAHISPANPHGFVPAQRKPNWPKPTGRLPPLPRASMLPNGVAERTSCSVTHPGTTPT
ncbi:hypothetical protein ACLOJK_015544 [Asimina triloba]